MTLASRLAAKLAGLPPATTAVSVDRSLSVPMPDGVELLADRWYPTGRDDAPVLLTRTPYGRLDLMARMLAERGYQVVQVSCRGTAGSGGEWVPFRSEQADGLATLQWLEAQPWFVPRVALFGASYFGLTQWAVAEDPPSWVKAIAPAVTASAFRGLFFPGGSFALETALSWSAGMEDRDASPLRKALTARRTRRQLSAAYGTLPLRDMDTALTGRPVPAFQEWIAHDEPDDPWWSPIDFGTRLDAAPPASMVAGWYDVFLADQLEDHKALTAAGRPTRLTVGPWHHGHPASVGAFLADTLSWADVHLRGAEDDRAPVRVQLLGTRSWLDLPGWPPPATDVTWYLQPGGSLGTGPAPASAPSRYRYDPADPTPAAGGATLQSSNAGPTDNRALEARADVLTFTTPVLDADTTVVGELTAELCVRSSLTHTDFFVRLCDVDMRGRSTNVSDGIVRLRPGRTEVQDDGSLRVCIRMSPTAVRFARGHRIRLQVSSGAHPVYLRNPGSGEPLASATRLVVAEQAVFHDPDHPSRVVLPLLAP